MVDAPKTSGPSAFKRSLAAFSFLTFAVSLILLYAGGFTTTIGAGMVFPDWPLSNGSLNPPGWVMDEAMRAEHGHRLLGALTGSLTLVLMIWVLRVEERVWLRRLAVAAFLLVVVQGVLGGARVLLVDVNLAQVHGVLGQIFICTLAAIAAGTSGWWRRQPSGVAEEGASVWRLQVVLGTLTTLAVVFQLIVGAIMRHRGAGLAIPYFPHAAPDGSFLPIAWNWATQIHFAHRVGAGVVTILLIAWGMVAHSTVFTSSAARKLLAAATFLLGLQIFLGAEIIWSFRQPVQTTLHVFNGALLLTLCWTAAFVMMKPYLEPVSREAREEQATPALKRAEANLVTGTLRKLRRTP